MRDKGTVTFRPRQRTVLSAVTLGRAILVFALVVVLLSVAVGFQRYRQAQSEYQEAVRQVEGIQALADSDDIYSMSQEDMAWLEDEFVTLEGRIDHIQQLSNLPFGIDGLLGDTPWVSQRYGAAMNTLEVGRVLAESGRVIANVGEEALTALDETGIRAEEEVDGETWLDVLSRREADLNEALDGMDEASAMRAEIDDALLPESIQNRLWQIDRLLERFAEQRELASDLPLAFAALGADEPVRYLTIFQNPTELRPTGGFVGTIALVEIHRGQILDYQFHDVYDISRDYQNNVEDRIDAPWAIREYVRPDELQYQDANWWPHFPTSARTMMRMTDAAGWPEVDAVVAVQPDAVTELLSITGPITVDVDGEEREVSADNLLSEAERQRRLLREGASPETDHKEVISLIGEVLVSRLAEGDRDDLVDAAFLMFDALNRRDMQAYHADADVQEFLEERTWAGQLQPEPDTPTLTSIFANVTGLKTSLVMQPEMHLELLERDTEGVTEAILTLSLRHLGDEQGDPFYEGFQRWWLDIILPEKATVLGTRPNPVEDPAASNGGAYVVDLDVGEREQVAVRFSMPQSDQLLLRRQPGLVTKLVTVEQSGCNDLLTFGLDRDALLLLDGDCPAVEKPEDDIYAN